MKEEFTIAIYSENVTGILSRVVGIFTRRHISINTLTVSESSIKGIHRMTVVIKVTEDQVQKVVAQCDKQVDILKAFYYHADEIVHQEIALYKVPTSAFTGGNSLEKLIRSHNARILEIEKEFGSFSDYIWAYVDNKPIKNHFKAFADVPVQTEISAAISKDLKKRGMSFVGATIIYAYMQAVGMVIDHLEDCWKY